MYRQYIFIFIFVRDLATKKTGNDEDDDET
jgi:hypothetical protein